MARDVPNMNIIVFEGRQGAEEEGAKALAKKSCWFVEQYIHQYLPSIVA